MLTLLVLAAVTSGAWSLPRPDPMARYKALTRAVVDCDPKVGDTITVCGHDRTTASQRLPLPDEIAHDGPRLPTGEMPSAAMALGGGPCANGCYVGMNLKKAVTLLGKVADHLLTGSDVYGPP